MIRRRELLGSGLVAAGAIALGPQFWNEAFAGAAKLGRGPYGPLRPPDENGLMLPEGFRSRVVARGGVPVQGTGYVWHIFSDGAATYRTREGGWVLVSNSEVPIPTELAGRVPQIGRLGDGGVSAIRFAPDGTIESAYSILQGTSTNCAGGTTPWGTWLSCEEIPRGRVWECDPSGRRKARVRPALGVFQHEAACVDPRRGHAYLTEDEGDGGFYRFTPRRKGRLDEGVLEIAKVVERGERRGFVEWKRVPDPSFGSGVPTRKQVKDATRFDRGEGIWYDGGLVYIATTGDNTIRSYDVRSQRLRPVYDPRRLVDPPLTGVDNITVSRSGDLYVCEDNGGEDPFDIGLITPAPNRRVTRFCKVTGIDQGLSTTPASSELAGVCFNPAGDRMYFASQRELFTGVVYEVRGPFRTRRPDAADRRRRRRRRRNGD